MFAMRDSIFFVLLLMEFSIYEPQKSNSCLASKVWQSGDPELTSGHGCGSISASDIRLSIFARQAVYNGKSVEQNLRPEDLYFIHWQKVIVFVRTMTAISPCSVTPRNIYHSLQGNRERRKLSEYGSNISTNERLCSQVATPMCIGEQLLRSKY